jgi:hypothetical protein
MEKALLVSLCYLLSGIELSCLVKIQLTENLLQKFKLELGCGSVVEYVLGM